MSAASGTSQPAQASKPAELPCVPWTDFLLEGATFNEALLRVQQLLASAEPAPDADQVSIDGMTINFATYQVTVNNAPLDLTYLEYALLAFLVTHRGRTFSRDELLRQVWGFEYYGGSRTVDVHVRRVRAKLGPELAQYLETVRGFGYLWKDEAH
jgi:DNA-binding response OmpR family regulator